jgi:hypothetical protein
MSSNEPGIVQGPAVITTPIPADQLIDLEKFPFLDLSVLCVPIPENPKDLCITLPGGFDVCAQAGLLPIGLLEYAKVALGSANSALAPLGPIFTVIEAIVAIYKCLAAIPDVIGPPPNPDKLRQVLQELQELVVKLMKLTPLLTVPLMMVQFLDMIIATIDGAASELTSLSRLRQQIQEAELRAAQAPGLQSLITCAHSSLASQMGNVERVFATINPIIQLMNIFAGLASLPSIPLYQPQPAPEPAVLAAGLQGFANDLRTFRQAIPV